MLERGFKTRNQTEKLKQSRDKDQLNNITFTFCRAEIAMFLSYGTSGRDGKNFRSSDVSVNVIYKSVMVNPT